MPEDIESKTEINFIPKAGNSRNINKVLIEEGSLILGYDDSNSNDSIPAGNLYFDAPFGNQVKRIPIASQYLREVNLDTGYINMKSLKDIEKEINSKLDRIPNLSEGNIITSNSIGELISSDTSIEDLKRGGASVILTEKILYSEKWDLEGRLELVGIPNITNKNVIIVSPIDIQEYSRCQVFCESQSQGSLTFKCNPETIPEQNISVTIYIIGERVINRDKFLVTIEIPSEPNRWTKEPDVNKKGYYCNCAAINGSMDILSAQNSIVTLSPYDPQEACKYNIMGTDIITNESIVIHCDTIPSSPLLYYALIENYS